MKGLKVLHDAGMFFGHLHASNVVVDDGVCRLVDVENGILGVPSFLRAAFTQHRKINVCTLPPSLLPSGPDRTGPATDGGAHWAVCSSPHSPWKLWTSLASAICSTR